MSTTPKTEAPHTGRNWVTPENMGGCYLQDALTQREFFELGAHLLNGNDERDFFSSWVPTGELEPKVAKNSQTKFGDALISTWQSVGNEFVESLKTPYAAGVYPRNIRTNRSCWGALDFDCHNERDRGTVELMVKKVWGVVQKLQPPVPDDCGAGASILIDSGRGYHIWLVGIGDATTTDWHRFLKRVSAAAKLDSGEIGSFLEYRPTTGRNVKGYNVPLRLPGGANLNTWNPARLDYKRSRFRAEIGLDALFDDLRAKYFTKDFPFNVLVQYCCERASTPVDDPEHIPPPNYRAEREKHVRRMVEKYRIDAPMSRHKQLGTLLTEAVVGLSYDVARECAVAQYEEAFPTPKTSLNGHLDDFEKQWQHKMETVFTSKLNEREAKAYGTRRSETSRAIFRIMWNFQKEPKNRKAGKFPFSGKNVGGRIGMPHQSVYDVRNRFSDKGWIVLIDPANPPHSAARYRWTLADGHG